MLPNADCQITIENLKGKLSAAYEYLINNNDDKNAQKTAQLAEKLFSHEFTVAFCGHFSAGKSKMINCLIDGELLPSSPIPTSANIVKVRSGSDGAKIFFKEGPPRLYLAPYDYDLIKKHCQDSEHIKYVEITHEGLSLPNDVVIMDTPGIDSTDSAHLMSTESALHLADMIFYVMDYNHVQSELNFTFTQSLAKSGKEIYLVINQVDKHSEQEIAFDEFQQSVSDSFAAWGVKPINVFYTSLKSSDNIHNQFDQLKDCLYSRLQKKDTFILDSIYRSLQQIMNNHLQMLTDEAELKLVPHKKILAGLSKQQQNELSNNYDALIQKKGDLIQQSEMLQAVFDNDVKKILDNAYLMPFQTRELAKSYLLSCEPGFKTGLFFARKKTAAEKEKRLDIFYKAIIEKTKSQIEWHIRSYLLACLENNQINDKQLIDDIQNFTITFSAELPAAAVKAGARVSDDYVSSYTDNVAAAIKHTAKKLLTPLRTAVLAAAKAKNIAVQHELQLKTSGLENYLAALKHIKNCRAELLSEQQHITSIFTTEYNFSDDIFHLFENHSQKFEIIPAITVSQPVAPQKQAVILQQAMPVRKISAEDSDSQSDNNKLKSTAAKLYKAAAAIADLPGFAKTACDLQNKAQRLQSRGLTIALFGAFSAGKSSFANALIGAKILPVSPNPMTAAINNIKPVSTAQPHKSVIIKLKTEQTMLADVNCALKFFELQADSLTDAIKKVNIIHNIRFDECAAIKTNYAFLNAFARGYKTFSQQLGTSFSSNAEEFGDYAVLEEKSCFVDWIDIYYDCPLTKMGITLVDTPGADSINARHTGVAFEYIKNSDAILFVTYYNHAFSKADREFLIQLGRVKESFQLDKMFFIINAIDLADNNEEKASVLDYVRKQLIKYGIKRPFLSPVSSLSALKAKQSSTADTSGISIFEQALYHFITHDMADMAVSSSINELHRINELIYKLINNTKKDSAAKEKQKSSIYMEKAAVSSTIHSYTVDNIQNSLLQETAELIYYVKQRVFLRFNDFFRESFNPAVLRADSSDLKKALQNALTEFLDQIGFDFAQEMRATTVRLDRFAEKTMHNFQLNLINSLNETNHELSYSSFDFTSNANIDFAPAFQNLSHDIFTKALSYFKNPKSFFEKDGSRLMCEELQGILDGFSDKYLHSASEKINSFYTNELAAQFNCLIKQTFDQSDDFYLSLLSALEGGISLEKLLHIQDFLMQLTER